MPKIHPTHTCFDDALDFIERLVTKHPKEAHRLIGRLMVVHGIYRLTDPENDHNTGGEPFAHAWVLDLKDNEAIQDGIRHGKRITYRLDLKEFYELFAVIDETRYSLEEVYRLNKMHNNYGPWKEDYIALCADKRKKQVSGI